MEFAKRIIQLVLINEGNIPAGSRLLKRDELKDNVSALQFLMQLFEAEEKAIAREHQKAYVTDKYENDVRSFAKLLIKILVEAYDDLNGCKEYEKLLGQRHVAYSYFHCVSMKEIEKKVDKEREKILYLGLAEFYDKFYGSFYDNEEAIELLCEYYVDNVAYSDEEEKLIASALYNHVSNAGTTSNTGFAYNGISLIMEYIGKLPFNIVQALLQNYRIYYIINQDVYRHQIFAIIDGANINSEDKKRLKFLYIDFWLLANRCNLFFYEKLRNTGEDVSAHHMLYDSMISNTKVEVLEKPRCYWGAVEENGRTFYAEEKPIYKIALENEEIIIRSCKNPRKMVKVKFLYYDWELRKYREEVRDNIERFILDEIDITRTRENMQLLFSLVYLDNYRGIKNQIMDFDHRYKYNTQSKKLEFNEEEGIPHFYGQQVHSLSCIVGKNGTGKTSIVDFLRESFLVLIKIIKDMETPVNDTIKMHI